MNFNYKNSQFVCLKVAQCLEMSSLYCQLLWNVWTIENTVLCSPNSPEIDHLMLYRSTLLTTTLCSTLLVHHYIQFRHCFLTEVRMTFVYGLQGPLINIFYYKIYLLMASELINISSRTFYKLSNLSKIVVLWCFFISETSEKIYNSTFWVEISV